MADVAPTLMDTVSFEDTNLVSVLANGWEPGSLLFKGIRVLSGRPLEPGDDQAVAARAGPGDEPGQEGRRRARVAGESFQVVGIFESDSLFENGALIVPLRTSRR